MLILDIIKFDYKEWQRKQNKILKPKNKNDLNGNNSQNSNNKESQNYLNVDVTQQKSKMCK